MSKVQVRLSMFEHPVEVDEEELPFLRAQRLVVEPAADDSKGIAKPVKPAAEPESESTR